MVKEARLTFQDLQPSGGVAANPLSSPCITDHNAPASTVAIFFLQNTKKHAHSKPMATQPPPPSWSDLEAAQTDDLGRRSNSYRGSLGPAVELAHHDQPRPQAPVGVTTAACTAGVSNVTPAAEHHLSPEEFQAWLNQGAGTGRGRGGDPNFAAKKRYVEAVCSCCCCCPQGCECVPGTGRPRKFALSEVLLKLPSGAARGDSTDKIKVLCCIPCCERDGPFVNMCDRAGNRCPWWCRACSAFAFLEVWTECCDGKRHKSHCADATIDQTYGGSSALRAY